MVWKTRQTAEILFSIKEGEYYNNVNCLVPVRFSPPSTSRDFLLEDTRQRESDHCQSNRLFCSCARCTLASELRALVSFSSVRLSGKYPKPYTQTTEEQSTMDRGGGERTDKVKICIDGERERESRDG